MIVNLLSLVFTWLARSSGEALLKMQGLSEADPGRLAKHAEYANYLTASVVVLFVAVVGFFLVDRFVSLPTWLANVLRVIAVIAVIAARHCCDCSDCSDCSDCDSCNDWSRRCCAGLEGLNERKSSYWAGRCGAKLAPWKGSRCRNVGKVAKRKSRRIPLVA
ncbi:hypothetical protein ACKFRT_07735 [Corynebacterium sp. YSMAA1_1_F7]|uniref:hypothetical protein n=1 Tax=Corynebacterium sp. YSMAA1_1_F7 TaxID=3383590 RepID=UPI0038D2352B